LPGFSEACMSGAHVACCNTDCRCGCHPWTQNLTAKKAQELARQAPTLIREATPTVELTNKCPKCGSSQKATDNFCRADGTRLMLGKQCERCGSGSDAADVFCWQCGWQLGEKPQPLEEAPQEDPLTRIRKIAKEAGLLKETVVS
jgi:Double zinc ribbon